MSEQLLHTPEGVRDIYGKEYATKLQVENRLQEVIRLYGYEAIQTPTFEFFVYSPRKSVQLPAGSFTSSLTKREIRWY